ncbi:hypothetical protein TNCT_276771 [Trichonephila clavata]|uniref:Uncharacterized protein n=1 Tax=Trichonephila clavata TaxID=2740835 RepID=A0A8X6GZ95_TRICU|nr:hypothetical protein TNCT_276771 [Trichonephila clavata]
MFTPLFSETREKSTRRVANEVQMSQLKSFEKEAKNLSDFDKQKLFEFCADMQLCFENDDFADHFVFTCKTTLLIIGKHSILRILPFQINYAL